MEQDQFVSSNQEGTNFREIVLNHLRRILEISSSELRQKTIVNFTPHGEQTKQEEDTRESYIQAVEALAIVLLPYFDKDMTKVYDNSEKVINAWNYEIEEMFSKEIKEIKEKLEIDNISNKYYIKLRIKHAKILFKELNLMLKRQDYLKSASFGE